VIRADLFGQKVVSRVASANAPKVVSAPIAPNAPGSLVMEPNGSNATKLVIVDGDRAGHVIPLDRRELTLGRAEDSDLIVDDEFASTNHAKLILINNDWLIQDLNSTNGTFLDGSRVGTPAVVKLNTPVRVGKTVFELRA
jgi:pSer/pThr/pTyr-binding forkhead associated (FHA) protein